MKKDKDSKDDIVIAVLTLIAGITYVFYKISTIPDTENAQVFFNKGTRDLILIVCAGWGISLLWDIKKYKRGILQYKTISRYIFNLIVPVLMIAIAYFVCSIIG